MRKSMVTRSAFEGELAVATLVQQRDLKSDVETHGPDVRVGIFAEVLVVDDQ